LVGAYDCKYSWDQRLNVPSEARSGLYNKFLVTHPMTDQHCLASAITRRSALLPQKSLIKIINPILKTQFQVQPFFKTLNESEMVFGDSFNCVGFFSVPIWSGLFVVFILLSITFYGIMMMMDIRTMDRFDDPKGKTITINAAE
jgi:hypothetical protein